MRAHQHSKCWLLMAVSVKCHCCFSQPLWAVGTVFFIPSLEHGNNLHFNWKCVTIPKAYGLVYVAHLQLTCSSLLTVRKLLQSISMSHYLVYFFIVVSSFIQTVVIKCCMLDILRRKINFAQSFGSIKTMSVRGSQKIWRTRVCFIKWNQSYLSRMTCISVALHTTTWFHLFILTIL